MRAVIQRVSNASVTWEGKTTSIGTGFLILLGIEEPDDMGDIEWLAGKIARLRIFADAENAMNLSLADVNGEVLIISQFTLHASTKKGNRPSFIKAAAPEKAEKMYRRFIEAMELQFPGRVSEGSFGAYMKVQLVNDGPVTILIDSRNKE